MLGHINGIDFLNMDAMLYWSYAKSYKGDSKSEIKNFILSGNYYGALKVDGYYQRIVKDEDGNVFMVARSKNVHGEYVNKIDWAPHLKKFVESLPNGTVLIAEVYLPNNEGSKKITSLLGCLKEKCIERQKGKYGKLHFYIFDVYYYNGKNYMNSCARERFEVIHDLALKYANEYVEWAHYYTGSDLWNKLQFYLGSGREGMVITRGDCKVYQKRTPARTTIKIKKELTETIDCFFTGNYRLATREYKGNAPESWLYWEDEKTGEKFNENKYRNYYFGEGLAPITKGYYYGWASSLEIGLMKDGKVVPIGYLSGLTDEIKANPLDYKYKVIEVGAMELTDDGKLRHGKMLGFRDDKDYTECSLEQLK